ncbi:MAG: hypothetical protein HYY24_15450 [Verrucomicrobia bacterium]|nr:hypothetical protein [Verrucomicrobiota bacterium]
MFLATTNKPKRLLYLSYFERVSPAEVKRGREEVTSLLADLLADFRLLADLSRLESMDVACAPEIGKLMELCAQKGVGTLVRVIPDPRKDIGLNILSLFHYGPRVHAITCQTMTEAAELLSLSEPVCE